MTTKTSALERELREGYILTGDSILGYEILKKGKEGALYNPHMRIICLRYTEGEDIYTLIKELNKLEDKR